MAALERSGIRPGQQLVVLGGTAFGLAALDVAYYSGLGPVAFHDDHEDCAKLALELGCTLIGDVVLSAVDEIALIGDYRRSGMPGPAGYVTLECTGWEKSQRRALYLARPEGTIALFSSDSPSIGINPNILVMGDKRVRAYGTYRHDHFDSALRLLAEANERGSAILRAATRDGASLTCLPGFASGSESKIEGG